MRCPGKHIGSFSEYCKANSMGILPCYLAFQQTTITTRDNDDHGTSIQFDKILPSFTHSFIDRCRVSRGSIHCSSCRFQSDWTSGGVSRDSAPSLPVLACTMAAIKVPLFPTQSILLVNVKRPALYDAHLNNTPKEKGLSCILEESDFKRLVLTA